MLSEEDLENFIKINKINAEVVGFENPMISSKDAYEATKGKIAKSVLLMADGSPVLCILFGDCRISFEKVRKFLGAKEIRLAKAKEVKEVTGYDIGALPPFGHRSKLKILVDKKLTGVEQELWLGGGSHYHLIRISKNELMRVLDATIVDLSE